MHRSTWIFRDAGFCYLSLVKLSLATEERRNVKLSLTPQGARSSRTSNPLSAIKESSLSNKSRRPLCRVSSLSGDATRIELWYKNHSTWWWYANKAFVSVVIFVAGEGALVELREWWLLDEHLCSINDDSCGGILLEELGHMHMNKFSRRPQGDLLNCRATQGEGRPEWERTPPLVVNNVAGPCCCFFSNPDRSATVLLALKMLVGWKTSIKGYFSVIISNWHQAKLVSTAIYPPSV